MNCSKWERFILSVQFGDKISDLDIGRLILDGVAGQPTEAHRTAASLAAYLAVHQDRNIPGTVVETLAKDIQRVLEPGDQTTQIYSRKASGPREVGQICAALPKGRNEAERQSTLYTRNLLNGLLPDGFIGTSPAAIGEFFQTNWGRLKLPHSAQSPTDD